MLRVGVVPQAFTVLLPRAIEGFRQACGCHLHYGGRQRKSLLRGLLAGELDYVLAPAADVGKLGRDIAPLTFVNLYEDDVCVGAGPTIRRRA